MSKTLFTTAAVAALSIVAVAGPASAEMLSVTDTQTRFNATGQGVKAIWTGFNGATDVKHTIVQANSGPGYAYLSAITGSDSGLLTVTCDFTKPNGETVERTFNNTVSLSETKRIDWGAGRTSCDVVTEVSLLVPVAIDYNNDGDVVGKKQREDALGAKALLDVADPNLRITVRADF